MTFYTYLTHDPRHDHHRIRRARYARCPMLRISSRRFEQDVTLRTDRGYVEAMKATSQSRLLAMMPQHRRAWIKSGNARADARGPVPPRGWRPHHAELRRR